MDLSITNTNTFHTQELTLEPLVTWFEKTDIWCADADNDKYIDAKVIENLWKI